MNKSKLLYHLWDSFGWNAYDEASVPTGENKPEFPYITYEVSTDEFGNEIMLTASLWTRSASWISVEAKADEIEDFIGRGGVVVKHEETEAWIRKASPFRRGTGDESDDMIKRIIINYTVEFFTVD